MNKQQAQLQRAKNLKKFCEQIDGPHVIVFNFARQKFEVIPQHEAALHSFEKDLRIRVST